MLKNSLTVGELRQAIAGKPDDLLVVIFEDSPATYSPIHRARAANIIQDRHGFYVDAPYGGTFLAQIVLALSLK